MPVFRAVSKKFTSQYFEKAVPAHQSLSNDTISFADAFESLKRFSWDDDKLEECLSNLGTSLPDYFKQNRRGGLDVQQVPSELANLILYLWQHHPRMASYLEIGIGKGGTFMVLNESWRAKGIQPNLFVADNFCYAPEDQRRHFEWLKQQYALTAHIGNTREEGFAEFLEGKEFEVVFIDGDHSFHGCLHDLLVTYPRLKKSGSMIFHDIASTECPGVKEVFEFGSRFFEHAESFVDSGSCGIGVLRGRVVPSIPRAAVRADVLRHQFHRAQYQSVRFVKGLMRRLWKLAR